MRLERLQKSINNSRNGLIIEFIIKMQLAILLVDGSNCLFCKKKMNISKSGLTF